MDHPVIQYIQEARGQGANNESILTELQKAGWHINDVVSIVLDHAKKTGVKELENIPEEETIISVRDVRKSYGKLQALDGVTLDIKRGSVTALLGPNGAGKTTLVRILTTLLPLDSGVATVAGLDVMRYPQELRSVIGLAGQYAAVDETLTGRENLEMVGRLYHLHPLAAKLRAKELLQQLELTDAADRTVRTYSGGMRRRLDLAASLVIRPHVLFLDEPTTGLDPTSRFAMWNIIRDLVENGATVLLTTQYLEEADQLADYIFVIDHGRLIAQGTADELKEQVGGDILELHLATHHNAEQAALLVKQFGDEMPRADNTSGIVTMAVSRGAGVLVEAIRTLDNANLQLRDVMLRRPSLDDVFVKLTGHATG